jgi:DNA-nicking Smr family endonuclease
VSPRRLSDEDRELWIRLRRSVRPLYRRGAIASPQKVEPPAPPAAPPGVSAGPAGIKTASPPAKPAAPPPLVSMDARDRRRLSRGIREVDARIDLHGMSQDRAFSALIGFLRAAQARGHRTVLVITGKGRGDSARGILRGAVPQWLARPDLRVLVLGIEEAGRRHGGTGALYVRLRRRG